MRENNIIEISVILVIFWILNRSFIDFVDTPVKLVGSLLIILLGLVLIEK